MSKVLINIGCLCGVSNPEENIVFSFIKDAFLVIKDKKILTFGSMKDWREYSKSAEWEETQGAEINDIKGAWVLPSFCDSHTHIVYARSREQEFEDRIKGLSYEEIAKRGGGILNSCDATRGASEEELYSAAMKRVAEVIEKGTGAIEIKSGYGLNTDSELKILRVIKHIKETAPITVCSTFLGAHAVPREYIGNKAGYVDLLCKEMLPAVAAENLADFVDVFCDTGYFSVEDTEKILDCAAHFGLKPKIHADELALSGGTKIGVKCNAVSVDHLERIDDESIEILKGSNTLPTVLPGASFFLRMPYAPARRMINHGLEVAIASDYNPGSSPSGDMRFMGSLACIKMKLSPEESLKAITLNGAKAMLLDDRLGSIERGKRASLIITEPLPSLSYLFYAYTTPLIRQVILP